MSLTNVICCHWRLCQWCICLSYFFLLPFETNKNGKRVKWFLANCNKYLSYERNLTLSNGIDASLFGVQPNGQTITVSIRPKTSNMLCYRRFILFATTTFCWLALSFDKFKGFFSVFFSHFIFTRKVVSDRWVFLQKGFPRPRRGLDAMQMRVTVIYSIRIVAENKNRMIHFPTTRAIYMFNMVWEKEKKMFTIVGKKSDHISLKVDHRICYLAHLST